MTNRMKRMMQQENEVKDQQIELIKPLGIKRSLSSDDKELKPH